MARCALIGSFAPPLGHVARRSPTSGEFMPRLATLFAALVLTCLSTPLVASAQAPSLNWGSEVNPSRCPTDQGYRYLEINVTRKVDGDVALRNAVDATLGVWASREFNQHIQVWHIGVPGEGGGERFCALVRYQGSFTTIDGQSPAGDNPPGGAHDIAAGIDGSFEGGYRLVFNADERNSPSQKTKGHIGAFEGQIGLYDWLDFYFTNFIINQATDLEWWGWVYHGGHNGAWVNSIDGDQGDITN
jgi:hypothetical protein